MNSPLKRIADYGMLADGETAALVSRDGTIEWLCLPRFDSEACFAALLGDQENGGWRLAPAGAAIESRRRYRPDSMILETELATAEGRVKIIDFMPIRGVAPDIVRIVEGLEGRVAMKSELSIRFDYGWIHPLVRRRSDQEVVAVAGPNAVALRFDMPITETERCFESAFVIEAGQRISLTMTWFASHLPTPKRVDPEKALVDTDRYWRDWAAKCRYRGPYRHAVIRSLLTLKALSHRPTGGIVAAPTASLPEYPQGPRNWDYRFCWLRDATFTLQALSEGGYHEEAEAWMHWLRRAVAGKPISVQPFYGVAGERQLFEWTAPWLKGFNDAQPVRFGNAAVNQIQIDAYGEVLLALSTGFAEDDDADALIGLLAQSLEEIWNKPDAGIWESRGPLRHHTFSKVMSWAAFLHAGRRLRRTAPEMGLHYLKLAERIRAQILKRGVDPLSNSFTTAFGEADWDASLLLIPLLGFLPADDPRVQATVRAIETQLMRDGLVIRYVPKRRADGLGGPEGAFLACSFWLANVYILQNRRSEAEALFERLLGHANDLGLLSEEVDWRDGSLLGNFPQALSHVALATTAMNLSEDGGPLRRRIERTLEG